MWIVRRKKEARIDSDRFGGFEWIAVGGVEREVRDNYKRVSCSVLALVEFWLAIRPMWLAFRVSQRCGISAFPGKKQVEASPIVHKNLRFRTWRHVLRQDHTRGSLVSTLSPFMSSLFRSIFARFQSRLPLRGIERGSASLPYSSSMQFGPDAYRK